MREEDIAKLLKALEEKSEENADFERRARRLSVKKELERIQYLQLIEEQSIQIRKLQDSYDLVLNSKWWKLTAPVRKAYEKIQKKKHQKTLTETLSEIMDESRYERFDYDLQKSNVYRSSAREFADGYRDIQSVLTVPYKAGSEYDATVSVIIPTYNAGSRFRRLLAALKGQKGVAGIEIIVVDSGSTDQTLEKCAFAGITPICIKQEDFSHSYARNLGADHAGGDYLLFMTQDAEPTDATWLYRMLSVLKERDAAAVMPMETDNGTGDLYYNAGSYYHAGYLGLWEGDHLTSYREDMDVHTKRKNAQLSDVSNLISKDLFMKYRYNGDYAEDLRLGLQLIRDGYHLAQLSSVSVYHAHNRSADYIRSRSYTDRKALGDIFPELITQAHDAEALKKAIAAGTEQMKKITDHAEAAKGYFDNPSVYGRRLGHALDLAIEESDMPVLLTGVKAYVSNVLMPYVEEKNAEISSELHAEILETIYKSCQAEVGAAIADCEIIHGRDPELLKMVSGENV